MKNALPILLTSGEPSGIGMDIILTLAETGFFKSLHQPVVVLGCQRAFLSRLKLLNNAVPQNNNKKDLEQADTRQTISTNWKKISCVDELTNHLNINQLDNNANEAYDFYLLDIPTIDPVIAGKINTNNAEMVLKQLEVAHKLAFDKKVSAIVTAPLQKSALIDAKLTLPDATMFSGHTEYFMQMSQCKKVVMMLANNKMKVALVTTHLPLSQVADAITKEQVADTVSIVHDSLCHQFSIQNPKILVCGLNPHAGEDGHLGMEEINIINPVLRQFQNNGYDVSDAMPADTLFTSRYLQQADAVIAMYHDQGLPVLKSHGFGDSVNITLGLPYVRTSVDHGTALDLAGSGLANDGSLKQAIIVALEMSFSIDEKNLEDLKVPYTESL